MKSVLAPYKKIIEKKLQEEILQLGEKSALRDACEYALLGGGKRIRPALVLMIAKALGHEVDVLEAAMGIEFFHTASLIADDLPCMDNDDERRNKPTTHRVFGESIALLATYALISAGYGCIVKNTQLLDEMNHPYGPQKDRLCFLALENASYNTGLKGVTGGQFLDIDPPNFSLSMIKKVIEKKSGTLFEISFVLGWLFGGGDPEKLPLVKKCASHFGMAFQIVDDLEDMAQDSSHTQSLNIANLLGKEMALKLFFEELDQFKQSLESLGLQGSDLDLLSDNLRSI